MTDSPNDQSAPSEGDPTEIPGDVGERGAADSTGTTPEGLLPLVEPFFGKNAFLIAAVPFIIYFIGTALGSHIEMTRKTGPAHDIRGYSTSMLTTFVDGIKSQLPPEQADRIIQKYDLEQVKDALEDESSKVEVLVGKCEKLLNGGDFEDEPPAIGDSLARLRVFVEEFLDIHEYWENDELNKIRPSFIEFAKENLPSKSLDLNDSFYPTLYSIACISALIAVLFALPHYLRKMPFRISLLAVAVGTIGVVLWVGIWWLNREYAFGNATSRASFNPFEELKDTPTWMWTFLGIRLLGMVIVIPIAEEFFTRSFLMRYCEDIDWDQIPIGRATWRGWAGILAYAAFSHAEIAAALVWFGMITWMYLKTKNIWDCVIAHAVTNGLLAAFVLYAAPKYPVIWGLW